jgi:hypothetical protein
MDIGKSLQFVFEDDQWPSKLGLGALISLIPILNFAWTGYFIDIMRNVTEGRELPLPGWDELGDKFIKGLLVTVASFIYALPGLIFLCVPIGIMIIPAFLQNQQTQGAVAAITTISGLALICCIGLYFLAFSFIIPAVQLQFSRKGIFQACFQLRDIFGMITKNLSDYLVAWLLTIVAVLIISLILGVLGAVIGWIPCLGQMLVWVFGALTGVFISVVYAHIFGQFGMKAFGATESEIVSTETK